MGSESESVGSCSQPSSSSPQSTMVGKTQSLQNSSDRVPVKGACFYCNEEGHWVRDCPRRSNPPGTPSPTGERRSYPELLCPCGRGACLMLTSRTAKNPDRDFYRCPANLSERCSFFKWCDEAASGHIPKLRSPLKANQKPDGQFGSPKKLGKSPNDTDLYPICSCGAGKCMMVTVLEGENVGRKYFACHIKKGHGACNHFQWVDTITKPSDNKVSDRILDDKEAVVGTEKAVTAVSPSPRHPPHPGFFGDEPKVHDVFAPSTPHEPRESAREPNKAYPQISPVKRLSLGEDSPGVGGLKHVRRLKLVDVRWLDDL